MEDEITCPKCHKKNGRYNFCTYCGEKLSIDINTEVQDPYCLNCARPVEKGQKNCECGYEFGDITCPECNAKNEYTNRFCTSCGEKLWQYKVYYYIYDRRVFEHHLIDRILPDELENTAVYKRSKKGIGKDPLDYIKNSMTINDYESEISKAESNIKEIRTRWKVVSPYYCIDCLNIIDPDEYTCPHCGYSFSEDDKKIVEYLKNENKYVKPLFENEEMRWTSKGTKQYQKSLAPAIGESQFEYRERLKWEFSENLVIIDCLTSRMADAIDREIEENERKKREEEYERQAAERRRREEEYIRQFGGGYCSYNCRYIEEEILTSSGISGDFTEDTIGVEYYCRLGHSVSIGGFCKDYE